MAFSWWQGWGGAGNEDRFQRLSGQSLQIRCEGSGGRLRQPHRKVTGDKEGTHFPTQAFTFSN